MTAGRRLASHRRTPRTLLFWLAGIAIAASGCGSDTSGDRSKADRRPGGGGYSNNDGGYGDPEPQVSLEQQRQQDWENADGDDWFEYTDGYSEGFEEGCDELFDLAGGALYEEELPYDVEYGDYVDRGEDWDEYDCERLEDDPPEDAPFDVPDDPYGIGHDAGLEDGCNAIFDDEYEYTLWSEDGEEIDGDDCERGYLLGGGYAGGSSSGGGGGGRTGPDAAQAPSAGSACPPASGVVIVATRGKVNCQGALALWRAWTERAPYEGTGSGGYLELDGWGCISAPAVDPVGLGSCKRLDETAEFTVMAAE